MKNHILLTILMIATLSSCTNDPEMPYVVSENGINYSTFDFATTFSCDISVNIGARDYVYIYADDPTENPESEALRTLWTDSKGHYKCSLTLPTMKIGQKLYALTNQGVLTAEITATGAEFKAGASTRSVNEDEELVPDKDLCINITNSYLSRIPRYYPGTTRVSDNLSRLVETGEIAVETKEDNTKVMFTFLHSFGWNSNYIYYYYYKGDDPVTEDNRQEIIDKFCSDDKFLCTRGWGGVKINNYNSGKPNNVLLDDVTILKEGGDGWINARFSDFDGDGDKDKSGTFYDDSNIGISNPLYFYGDDYSLPYDEGTAFPAGYKIGLIMKSISNTEKNKLIDMSKNPTFSTLKYLFSNPNANPADQKNGNRIHVGRFWSSSDANNISRFVYGFEDSLYGVDSDPDYNFTDFMCMVSTNPGANVELVSSLSAMYTSEVGTMIYEDNYPAQGDYDMNDVIVEFRKVKEIELINDSGVETDVIKNMYVELTPIHYGADYNNYLYVQCHDKIGQKVCEPQYANFRQEFGMDLRAVCEHNERQIALTSAPDLKTLRLYLIKDFVPVGKGVATHYFEGDITEDDMDIFLYVNNTGREVHVTDQRYAGLGSLDGLTEQQKLYKAQEYGNGFYPWAMKIPLKSSGKGYQGFIPVTERIQIIYEYLGFGEWVSTNGKKSTDWYLNQNYTPYEKK